MKLTISLKFHSFCCLKSFNLNVKRTFIVNNDKFKQMLLSCASRWLLYVSELKEKRSLHCKKCSKRNNQIFFLPTFNKSFFLFFRSQILSGSWIRLEIDFQLWKCQSYHDFTFSMLVFLPLPPQTLAFIFMTIQFNETQSTQNKKRWKGSRVEVLKCRINSKHCVFPCVPSRLDETLDVLSLEGSPKI